MVSQFSSIFNFFASKAPTAVIKLQKFMVNLRAIRLNASAALKKAFTAFPISYTNVFSHRRGAKIFHPFVWDYFFVMFFFLSFLSCRFIL
jgi:hypothetical protein